MIARIAVGLGGAAIGAVLGWTIKAFVHWTPAVIIVAVVFGLLAVLNDLRENPPAGPGSPPPTRLFPPDEP